MSPTWPAALSVTPASFRTQIRRLLRRGYKPVTFSSAVQSQSNEKLLAITFDDAYRSVLSLAAPILDEFDAPATVFAPTAHVGSGRPMVWPGVDRWLGTEFEEELMPLGWPELTRLADGGWEVGSHTESHPRLSALDDGALRRELVASRAVCEERLSRPCLSIAYPYGDVDARVVAACADAGFSVGAGLPGEWDEHDPLQWPRVGVYHSDGAWRFELKVATAVRRLRASPLRPAVSRGLRSHSRA